MSLKYLKFQGYGSLKAQHNCYKLQVRFITSFLIIMLRRRKMASSSRQPRQSAKEYRKKIGPKSVALHPTPTRLYNFGPDKLFSFNENKFVALDHVQLDKTQFQKHIALQALSQYMSSIQKKPTSKNFSHYVEIKGKHTGVFVKWNSIKKVTEGHEWPIYKGFYTLEHALDYARQHLGHVFYIEEGTPVALIQATYELENQL